jgi:hypothetical protein
MIFKRRFFTIACLCLASGCLSTYCLADDRAADRATLRGVRAVVVKVHSWEPEWRAELEKAGMSESLLQSLIEQRLEKAGIQVVAEETAKNFEALGILNVRMAFSAPEPAKKTFEISSGEKLERLDPHKKYIYALRLNFRQPVALLRAPAVQSRAITWQTEAVGMKRLAVIREDVNTAVDVFIEAFLSENPNLKKTE